MPIRFWAVPDTMSEIAAKARRFRELHAGPAPRAAGDLALA